MITFVGVLSLPSSWRSFLWASAGFFRHVCPTLPCWPWYSVLGLLKPVEPRNVMMTLFQLRPEMFLAKANVFPAEKLPKQEDNSFQFPFHLWLFEVDFTKMTLNPCETNTWHISWCIALDLHAPSAWSSVRSWRSQSLLGLTWKFDPRNGRING